MARVMTGPLRARGITRYLRAEAAGTRRIALTREVWEATNECWLALKDALARQVRERDARVEEMRALAYNDLAADRQVVAAVQAMEGRS